MMLFGDIQLATAPVTSSSGRFALREAERAAVATLISSIFGPEARYCHTAAGAPFVEGRREHISVSHGAGLAVVAVSPRPVGVDVECWRPQLASVASRFLDADEFRRYSSPDDLLHAWTAKEAAFKASGITCLVLSAIRLPQLDSALLPDGRRLSIGYHRVGDALIAIAEEKM